jgi:hypothetical protein
MSSRSHEAEIESWTTVLGLSSKTVELAKQLLQRVKGKKICSMSRALLALYAASIMSGEYIPLTYFITARTADKQHIKVRPKRVRYDLKKYFGIELSPEKLVEIETRGFCRVLKLDALTCEAAVCTAVSMFSEFPYIHRKTYATFVTNVIRFVAKHLNRNTSLLVFFRRAKAYNMLIARRARKYVDVCIEKVRAVSTLLQ